MARLVLKDGTTLDLTANQQNKLGMAVLFSKDMNKARASIGGHVFFLKDIVTDPDEIERLTQSKMDLGDLSTPKKYTM